MARSNLTPADLAKNAESTRRGDEDWYQKHKGQMQREATGRKSDTQPTGPGVITSGPNANWVYQPSPFVGGSGYWMEMRDTNRPVERINREQRPSVPYGGGRSRSGGGRSGGEPWSPRSGGGRVPRSGPIDPGMSLRLPPGMIGRADRDPSSGRISFPSFFGEGQEQEQGQDTSGLTSQRAKIDAIMRYMDSLRQGGSQPSGGGPSQRQRGAGNA